ncbi:LysR substrate-binding domain-containing protein [Microbacterium sp. A204]|uniref:LysR substrate-binding domain-containing protein n=1 Tax=Microbacterium sp. A204 TaxID=3457321 RepID=UPI003FD362AF
MDLQQLRYVVAVADTESFTRAAAKCFVTQSALSHQIAALEREIGQRLFARTSRSVRLTEAGTAFVTHAREALIAVNSATEEAVAAAGEVRGTLRLGVIPTVTAVDVPHLLRAFHDAHPHTRVELRVGNSDALVAAVRSSEIDVALLGLREGVVPASVAVRQLARGRLLAVLPGSHRLASRRRVSLADLADETFADFPAGTSGRAQSDAAFESLGISRDVAYEADSADLILSLVSAGLAIALLPPGIARETGAVVALRLVDGPVRVEYAAWDQLAPRSVTRAFVAVIEAAITP